MSCLIRVARPEDAEEIASIYAPYCESTAISFELEAPDAVEMAARMERVQQRYPWLVLEENGRAAGYAYGYDHRERAAYRWSVDCSAYVAKELHRRGIGRALYTALFELLSLQGFYRVHAGITLPNAGSVGLHAAMGFELVGIYKKVGYKMAAWHDVAWYQMALRPGEGRPREPKAFSEIEPNDVGAAFDKGLLSYRLSMERLFRA